MSQDIRYEEHAKGLVQLSQDDLAGFFVGWPERPSASVLLSVLAGSYCCFMARTSDGRVVGIVTAISDGVLSAHIPLLEVLPEFQRRGIGSQLMSLVLARLEGLYMIDLCCDAELMPFYRRFEMTEVGAMALRRPTAISSRVRAPQP